jgi:hypothetical protein
MFTLASLPVSVCVAHVGTYERGNAKIWFKLKLHTFTLMSIWAMRVVVVGSSGNQR